MELVELDKNVLVKTFKKKYESSIDPKLLLEMELQNLERLFDIKEDCTAEDVKIILAFWNGVYIEGEQLTEWKDYLHKYLYGNYDFDFVTPHSVNIIKHTHSLGFLAMPIGPPPISVLTFHKYWEWLKVFKESSNSIEPANRLALEELFDHTFAASEIEAELMENDFVNSYNAEKISEDELKKLLQTRYDELRNEVNTLRHLYYYDNDEKLDVLKNMFVFHAYFNGNLEKEASFLKKSLSLKKHVTYIQWELDDAFKQQTLLYLEKEDDFRHIELSRTYRQNSIR
ncbi:hypothetical protein LWM68_08050 [Niabella sp. W65]|nr:hypothetical protein [Niabella sp. W65]MCH7362719.1 hypothetical protein [Niabella sp. W65]